MDFRRSRKRGAGSGGQVMSEYAIMLAMFAMAALVFLLLLAGFLDYGWRVLALIAWEPYT